MQIPYKKYLGVAALVLAGILLIVGVIWQIRVNNKTQQELLKIETDFNALHRLVKKLEAELQEKNESTFSPLKLIIKDHQSETALSDVSIFLQGKAIGLTDSLGEFHYPKNEYKQDKTGNPNISFIALRFEKEGYQKRTFNIAVENNKIMVQGFKLKRTKR